MEYACPAHKAIQDLGAVNVILVKVSSKRPINVNANVSGYFGTSIVILSIIHFIATCQPNCQSGFDRVRGCLGSCRTNFGPLPFCCNCIDGFREDDLGACIRTCPPGFVLNENGDCVGM